MDVSQLELDKVKAVLFDLDGTLYDLKKMQKIMRKKILLHLISKPWRYREILIVYHFRKDRKKAAGSFVPDLQTTQYRWLQRRYDLSLEELEAIVQKWMFDLPLKHLKALAFPSLYPFLDLLSDKKIPFGVHSDLPIGKKLEVLGINPNHQSDACSEELNVLKPHPGGIMKFSKQTGIPTEEILVLGDKKKLDGEMARFCEAPFIYIQRSSANRQYQKLLQLFQKYPDPPK